MQQQNTHSQWLQNTNDVESIVAATKDLFRKIETLNTTDRDQVYSRLRNDAQFSSSIEKFQPQSV